MRTVKTTRREIVQRIMYVCEACEECSPESCGHFDRTELAVTEDDRWLCEGCWDEYQPDAGIKPRFSVAPRPPEHRAPIKSR